MSSQFVYVTYIRTTPAKLWQALTSPEFTRRYWFGVTLDSEWRPGSTWKMFYADGTLTDAGEILEAEPEKRLVIKWQNQFRPELKAEGFSRCTFDIAREGDTMKLTVTHEMDRDRSKTIEAVSDGWPKVLSSLKSMLETGTALARPSGSRQESADAA